MISRCVDYNVLGKLASGICIGMVNTGLRIRWLLPFYAEHLLRRRSAVETRGLQTGPRWAARGSVRTKGHF